MPSPDETTTVRNLIFAAPADDPRARRPVDALILVASVVVVWLAGWAHNSQSDLDQRVAEFFAGGLPGWISAVFTVVFIVGGVYAVVLLVSIWIFGRKRGAITRDMLLAGGLAVTASTVTAWIVGPEWPDLLPELLERGAAPSFPVLRLAFTVAVLRVAGPYLALPMRRVGRRLVVPMAVSAVVLSYGFVSTVIGGLAVGTGSAAVIHLIFGSGIGIPSRGRIVDALRTVEIEPTSLEYLPDQPIGATLLWGRLVDGRAVQVKVYGRDASDAAAAARVWRSTWYSDDSRALTATGLQQVEHESLMLLAAARADVPVPELVGWGRGEAGDAVLVTERPAGDRLSERSPDEIDDPTLARCWDALLQFRQAGIAHHAIDRARFVLHDDEVVVDGLDGAVISPDHLTEITDVAQMLVATAIAVGPERAIAAARAAVGDEVLAEALQVTQRSALPSTLQADVKDAELDLKELRAEAAAAVDAEVPELVQLARVTWGNVAMVVLTVFAAYALISSLADIGFDTIVDELSTATWGWVITALILAQLTNVGEWISLTGMVDRPVPFGPTLMFRYAISFISLAVPSDAGAIAMNIRYMQRLGVSPAAAVAQGPLLTIFTKIFDVLLLIITARIIGQTIELDDIDSGPALRILMLVVILAILGLLTVLFVPGLRARVLPPVKEAFTAVRGSVTNPERLLRVAGGTLMQRLLFAMTLAASVAAYGQSISFSEAIFVNSAVSLFIGLMPVPGGIGVGEAALTAGLTAVGVPEGPAVAAAITHRMVTSYLPPIYGWYTTRWLTQRDYL